MPVRRWLAPWLGLCMVAGSATTGSAQSPYGPPPGSQPPVMVAPNYYDPSQMVPPGVAQQMNPYPGVEYYGPGRHRVSQSDRGLWLSDYRRARRDYFGSIGYMATWSKSPGDVLLGYEGSSETFDIVADSTSTLRLQSSVRVVNGIPIQSPDLNYFGFRPLSMDRAVSRDLLGHGAQLQWGFEDHADDTSLILDGWITNEGSQLFEAGQYPTFDIQNTIFNLIGGLDPDTLTLPSELTQELFRFTLSALNPGLTIDRGDGVAEVIPYDQFFSVKYDVRTWGAGATFLSSPIKESDNVKVRPVFNVSYMSLREGYHMFGADSGASYSYQSYEDGGATEAEIFARIAEIYSYLGDDGLTDVARVGQPIGDNDDFFLLLPQDRFGTAYTTTINSSVESHIAGPQLGLRLDVDGDTVDTWFQVSAGAAAVAEQLVLSGDGVYNRFGFSDGQDNLPIAVRLLKGLDPAYADTQFSDAESNVHISPMADLSANLEMKLFRHLPILRKYQAFEDATFRASYGFKYVGLVANPVSSVNYATFPINPSIDVDRRSWYQHRLNLSAQFDF